jgi:para-nitrobenzyl esterase
MAQAIPIRASAKRTSKRSRAHQQARPDLQERQGAGIDLEPIPQFTKNPSLSGSSVSRKLNSSEPALRPGVRPGKASRCVSDATTAAGLQLLSPLNGEAQSSYQPIVSDPVAVDGGAISGTYLPSGVKAYFGVPFAAPPVRENRWREPQPVLPWPGVYAATHKMPECIQPLRNSSIGQYFGEEAIGEDCLYLNLWAPADATPGTKLPVVVWFHGGAYAYGSASTPVYSGEPLAQKGVIYVAASYRVGVMGFLAHPEITANSPHQASGNWGLLDQLAALQWTARNIAHFGGDPANVTIAGQSAGALSVSFLQAIPLARGLFARVVGMSGGAFANKTLQATSVQAQADGLKVQEALKVTDLAQMRTISGDKVLAAAAGAGYRPAVVIDGWPLSKSVEETFRAHEQNDVPALVGSTSDDLLTNIPLRSAQTVAEYNSASEKQFGHDAGEFRKLYPVTTDAQARAQAQLVGMSSGLGAWAYSWALHQVEDGHAPAYLFRFSLAPPYHAGVTYSDMDPSTAGAFHAADVPYWLGTYESYNFIRKTRDWRQMDVTLSNQMMDVLVAFARTGDPSTHEIKVPRFTIDSPMLIDFGKTVETQTLDPEGMQFLLQHGATVAVPPVMSPGAPRPIY